METPFHIGTTHDRPDLWKLNTELKARGTPWRATIAKSIGLHVWNPNTHECRLPDSHGFVNVPVDDVKWIIVCKSDDSLAWSNCRGWVEEGYAIFSTEAKEAYTPPVSFGEWMEFLDYYEE